MTGGHLTPALAVIYAFRSSSPKTKFIFIGREFSQEKEGMRSRESDEMKKLRIPFFSIKAAKFHRTYFWRNAEELIRLVPSFKQTYDILTSQRPDVFISFGGYLAVPVAIVCRFLKIPILTHEQTRTCGLANQLIGKIADIVAISYEQSRKYFAGRNIVFTGNPVRPSFLQIFRVKPAWLDVPLNKPLIYATGGSQGSHVLNLTLKQILAELTEDNIVVHQCGASDGGAYLHELEEVRATLPKVQQRRYIIREWVGEQDVAWIFQHADLVVARSGANTVHEVMISAVPAIFVPLPFAHRNEQLKNAQLLEEKGAAVILQQQDLIPKTLLETVRSCLKRREKMREQSEKLRKEVVHDAAERIAELARTLAPSKE
jgi:UDP-N-acetylglucosamine--N-acetylmuramyl-(pentapeptide) pyrophosphoryl-undecaprenol N-acetylglucosamine transferase